MLFLTTTADNVDTEPVVLGKASSALKGEELTVAKAHVHYGLDITHSTSLEPPSLSCRPLTLPCLNLPGGLSNMFQSIIVIILDVKMESLQAL